MLNLALWLFNRMADVWHCPITDIATLNNTRNCQQAHQGRRGSDGFTATLNLHWICRFFTVKVPINSFLCKHLPTNSWYRTAGGETYRWWYYFSSSQVPHKEIHMLANLPKVQQTEGSCPCRPLQRSKRKKEREREKKPHKVLSDDDIPYLLTSEPSARGLDFTERGRRNSPARPDLMIDFTWALRCSCESWAPSPPLSFSLYRLHAQVLWLPSDWWRCHAYHIWLVAFHASLRGLTNYFPVGLVCPKKPTMREALNITVDNFAMEWQLCKQIFEKREKDRKLTDQRQYSAIKKDSYRDKSGERGGRIEREKERSGFQRKGLMQAFCPWWTTLLSFGMWEQNA